MTNKIIIAGSRTFSNYELLKLLSDSLLGVLDISGEIEIVSGGATGADILGEQYAIEHGYYLKRFPAEWSKFGKSAGPIRNTKMAEYADYLFAFWDGESKGTKHMIDAARDNNLVIAILIVGPPGV